jgi:cephalosporin hydroxylase
MPRTSILLLAALSLLLAVGNVLQWRSRHKPIAEDETIGRFAQIWTDRLNLYSGSSWLGIQTLQNPTDAWVTQEIIHELKPDFIVEAGTYKGGSALLWAMILEQVKPQGRVITIDVEDQVGSAKFQSIWKERIDFLVGSSTDPAIVAEVARRVQGGRVLVILDSLHTRDHVLAELRAYSPLVGPGSYVIVQDTGLWRPLEDPAWASQGVQEFLETTQEFEVDHDRERFLVTNNPGGYLKRVGSGAEKRGS